MSDQRAENSCGSHGADPNGQPLFDYTCDDCMLKDTLDPDDIDRYGNRYANYKEYEQACNDLSNTEKGVRQSKAAKEIAARLKAGLPPF